MNNLRFTVCQLILLVIFLVSPTGPTLWILKIVQPLGSPFSIVGLIIIGASAWRLGRFLTPSPAPRSKAVLRIDGLYRWVRHPMYSGVLVWALGVVLSRAGLFTGIVFALLWLFFTFKARYEERLLCAMFPGYAAYKRHTPRFIPNVFKVAKELRGK